jgi:glycosyltransferase involved in cell wall biosynthesis
MSNCEITVVIPTYKRLDQLLEVLTQIELCNPRPDEVIVHVDGDDTLTATAICNSQFKGTKILQSPQQVGPGGGRNRAIAAAKNAIVASFDDDSYPIDPAAEAI